MQIFDANSLTANPVHAKTAHAAVSAKYRFASSEQVLAAFADKGWLPAKTTAVAARLKSRQGFQKHMVVLENEAYPSMPGLTGYHDSRPQLVMVNSHDRGSAVRILWGMIRYACLNGIINGAVGENRIIHNTKLTERLPLAIAETLAAFPTMQAQAAKLANATLSKAAVEKLIKTAYDARLAGGDKILAVDYSMPRLKRHEDQGNDAFTVFNRIQEVTMRGGINYRYAKATKDWKGNATSTPADGRTRALTAIDASVKLNQLMYSTVLELV